MIKWLVRHIDAIEDNVKVVTHSDTFEDLRHILSILYNAVWFIMKRLFMFIMIVVIWELLWCILN